MVRKIQELPYKGLTSKSLSSCVVPFLLAPMKEGAWSLCIDSREINRITMRCRFPMPRIEDLLDQLGEEGTIQR